MKVGDHLRRFHKEESASNSRLAECHKGLAETHGKIASNYEDDSKLAELHKALSDGHTATSECYEKAAQRHTECADAIGDLTLKTLVPTDASGILDPRAGIRKVLREGQPTEVDAKDVPAEFQNLVAVE